MQNEGEVKHADDDVQEGLSFDVEGDVLDDNGRRNNLILVPLDRSGGGIDLGRRGGTSSGRKVGVVIRRERPVFGGDDGIVQPLL